MKRMYEIKKIRGRFWVRKYVGGIWLHIASYRDMTEATVAMDLLREIHDGNN